MTPTPRPPSCRGEAVTRPQPPPAQRDRCRGEAATRPQPPRPPPAFAKADELPPVATGGLRGVGYGAIILAAGLSSRMGENKLLLPWRDGQPIVRHVASRFVQAPLETVLVVTGRDAELVRAALDDLDLTCIHNPDFAVGEMLSSVKAGLRALPAGLRATFIQPADMPCLPAAVIGQLLAAHEPGWNLAPVCDGRRGHPALLDRAHWAAMLNLPADARPRAALEAGRLRLLDVADAGVLLDVDTRESYERLMKSTGLTARR